MKRVFFSIFFAFISLNVLAVNDELILADEFPNKLSDFTFFNDGDTHIESFPILE